MELNFVAPAVKNGEKVVLVSKEEIASGVKSWKNALIGYVWGPIPSTENNIPIDMLILDKLILKFVDLEFRKYGNVKFYSKGLGVYLFDFESSEAKQLVLDKGAWFLERKSLVLVLKPWTPDFDWGEKGLKSVPIWIKLPNLKLHLWSVQVLSKIASVVGTPLFTDKITASRERVDYARICVEMPFDRAIEIPNSVTIEDEKGRSYVQEFRYEWLPYKCLRCKEFWHPNSDCPLRQGRSNLQNSRLYGNPHASTSDMSKSKKKSQYGNMQYGTIHSMAQCTSDTSKSKIKYEYDIK